MVILFLLGDTLNHNNLFCEPVICLRFGQYSVFGWELFFLWHVPTQTSGNQWWQEGRGGRGLRKGLVPLGHLRSRVPFPSSALTGHFLRFPTRGGAEAALRFLRGFPVTVSSSGSFAQALLKANHISVALVLEIK